MTRVQVRVIAPDEKTRDRAIRQLEAGGVSFTSPPRHPGRQGDWLAYGELDAEPAPDEPTRRRSHYVQASDPSTGRYVKIDATSGRIIDRKKTAGPYKGIRELLKGTPAPRCPTCGGALLIVTNNPGAYLCPTCRATVEGDAAAWRAAWRAQLAELREHQHDGALATMRLWASDADHLPIDRTAALARLADADARHGPEYP